VPFYHGAHTLDLSIAFTTFFLLTSLLFRLALEPSSSILLPTSYLTFIVVPIHTFAFLVTIVPLEDEIVFVTFLAVHVRGGGTTSIFTLVDERTC